MVVERATERTNGLATSAVPTFGVEEEYLLLHPASGIPVPLAAVVLDEALSRACPGDPQLQPELVRCQLELATPVSSTVPELTAHLERGRRALATAAADYGVILAPVGAAPFEPVGTSVSELDRYRRLYDAAPGLVDEQLISGMHVHVAVPDRDTGVQVLNRLRPWLHVLLALSANSPRWRSRDSGFASWRSVHAQRWPVHGAPPYWIDVADYDRHVATMLATRSVVDEGQLYWQMRLSPRYPTVEIRVFDVCLDAATAAALAALVRGLVMASLAALEARTGPSPTPVGDQVLAAASWQAARNGVGSQLVSCESLLEDAPRLRPTAEVVEELLRHVGPALDRAGDGELVRSILAQLLVGRGGAQRQRRAWAAGGPTALLELLASSAVAPTAAA
jgi:carboxylate-amine ligase